MAAKKFPKAPARPERICWGCDLYCPANDMRCGNGSDRTQHPAELFGEDWESWAPEFDTLIEFFTRDSPAGSYESSTCTR